METAQKIQNLEAKKQQIIRESIITENALQGLRQQVSGIEGQLIELRLVQLKLLKKEDDPKKKTATS